MDYAYSEWSRFNIANFHEKKLLTNYRVSDEFWYADSENDGYFKQKPCFWYQNLEIIAVFFAISFCFAVFLLKFESPFWESWSFSNFFYCFDSLCEAAWMVKNSPFNNESLSSYKQNNFFNTLQNQCITQYSFMIDRTH